MLASEIQNTRIGHLFRLFSGISMLTAFLGVSLCLFDFLADGLKLRREKLQGAFLLFLVFLPPLAIVLMNPGIYLSALSYAGIFCVVLLLLLPAVMAGVGRYQGQATTEFKVPGGFIAISVIILTGIGLLIFAALTFLSS